VPLPEIDSDCITIRVFFNEINPYGFVKYPSGVKYGFAT